MINFVKKMTNSTIVRTDGVPQNKKVPQEVKRNRNRCTSIQFVVDESELQRFTENENFEHLDEYTRAGKDPSLLVIFNQKTFVNNDLYMGSNRDVNELILTFGRLGHNIEQEFIYNGLSKEKILSTVNELSQRDFSNRNSLIVVVLASASKNNTIYAQNGEISTHEIWEPFYNSKCASFKNKPKLFIFQASKNTDFTNVNEMDADLFPECIFCEPLEEDMLIAYAVQHSTTKRQVDNGSCFIKELCRNLNAYGRRDDVFGLLLRTTKCIVNNYFHVTNEEEVLKQIPLFISTLTRKFYLTKSKERHLLVKMINHQEEILQNIKDIKTTTYNKRKK